MPHISKVAIQKRLMDKVVVDDNGCWLWQGRVDKRYGYGSLQIKYKRCLAHCVSYECFIGPKPDGMDLDHLCRVRHCINPEHLEVVTRRENLLRGEHPNMVALREGRCTKGHDVTEENAYHRPDGRLLCRICMANYPSRIKSGLLDPCRSGSSSSKPSSSVPASPGPTTVVTGKATSRA